MEENNDNNVLSWSPKISVYNDIIDEQHKKLLKQIGILAFALKTGEAGEKIKEILNFLDDYIINHLRYEEKYMIENEYPGYEQHRKIHEDAEKEFGKFQQKIYDEDYDKIKLAEDVEKYMRQWWINHITVEDKKYADYIKSK